MKSYEIYKSTFEPVADQIEAVVAAARKAIAAVTESQSKTHCVFGDIIRLDVSFGVGSSFYNDRRMERKKAKRYGEIEVKIYIDGQSTEICTHESRSFKGYRKWLRYYLREVPKELLCHVEVSCVVVKCVWVNGGSIKKRSRPIPDSIAKEFFTLCEGR